MQLKHFSLFPRDAIGGSKKGTLFSVITLYLTACFFPPIISETLQWSQITCVVSAALDSLNKIYSYFRKSVGKIQNVEGAREKPI